MQIFVFNLIELEILLLECKNIFGSHWEVNFEEICGNQKYSGKLCATLTFPVYFTFQISYNRL